MPKRPEEKIVEQVQSLTPGTTIRIEEPKSNRKSTSHNPATVVVEEITPQINGFVDFLRQYAVVGLAIGFIIGLQAQTLVKQLVSSFIDPAFQLFFGQTLQSRTFVITSGSRHIHFGWGAFVYQLLDFLFVLAAIYAIVKFFSLDKLDKPKKRKRKEEEQLDATVI